MIMAAIGVLLVMGLFPETPAGRGLHRYLVELPLQRLARVERHQLIYALIVVAMLLFASEVIVLAGSFDLAILYAWDLSLYVDAVVAMMTLAATTRLKPLAGALWTRTSRPLAGRAKRPASRRKRSAVRPRQGASNDTDPYPVLVAAWA